jgi:hypothetical protein
MAQCKLFDIHDFKKRLKKTHLANSMKSEKSQYEFFFKTKISTDQMLKFKELDQI